MGGGAQMKRYLCSGGRGTDEEVHVQCGGGALMKRYMEVTYECSYEGGAM